MMFWTIAILLILIALAFLLPPLLRKQAPLIDNTREQNIKIARQELAELEADFKAGKFPQETYEERKDELELALYDDLHTDDALKQQGASPHSIIATVVVALLVPAIAIGMYVRYGEPLGIQESQKRGAQMARGGAAMPDLDQAVAGLEEKLKTNPDNVTGWVMLGRTYMVLKKPQQAARALEKANALQPDDPKIMLPLADALALVNNRQLGGRPEQLIRKSLEIEPDNEIALWLAGMAARQRGDNSSAVKYWNTLLPKLQPGSSDSQEVRQLIAEAGGAPAAVAQAPATANTRQQPATAQAPAAANTRQQPAIAGQGIKVSISLPDAMAAKASPDQVLFIYAKAMSGPPMPLAAVRKQVRDLPLEVTLNDSMAMMPNLKLSAFPEVKVGARISNSGTPMASPGDLFAEQGPVKLGDSVNLVIDQVVQ